MNLRVLNQRLEMPPEDGAAQVASSPAPDLAAPAAPGSATPATAEALESHINELLADDAEYNGATPATPVTTSPASHVQPAPSAPVAPTSPVAQPMVQAPTPAAPTQTPQPAVQPAPAAPVPAAVAPVTPAPTPEVPPVVQPPVDQEARRVEAQKRREVFTQSLEKLYEVPEAQRADVNVNPATLLPKLAARLHVEVLEAATQGLAAVIPQIVAQVIEQRQSGERNEQEFFAVWPQLKRENPQHQQTVKTLLGTIVSMNPRISKADAIRQAGAAALVALGIPYEQGGAQPAPARVEPPTFSAAAPGSGGMGTPSIPGANENPFAKLSREFEEEL